MQNYSLPCQILLSPPDTSSTKCHFTLAQPLHSFWGCQQFSLLFPGAYWTPSDLGDSSLSVTSCCPFIQIIVLPLWLSWDGICLHCGRRGFDPWVGKIPCRRERLPTPVFWPGEFHGFCSPWGRKELDTTEQISFSLSSQTLIQHCKAIIFQLKKKRNSV